MEDCISGRWVRALGREVEHVRAEGVVGEGVVAVAAEFKFMVSERAQIMLSNGACTFTEGFVTVV
ncbi:hypothetical protein FRC08_012672 [Ceratobasidium sp. 394]|nr:hypothetical protein FRC08_012672 [Ceratobasidium sp. 394]